MTWLSFALILSEWACNVTAPLIIMLATSAFYTGVMFCIVVDAGMDSASDDAWKRVKTGVRWTASILLLTSIIGLIPDKELIFIIAGIELGDTVLQSPEFQRIVDAFMGELE